MCFRKELEYNFVEEGRQSRISLCLALEAFEGETWCHFAFITLWDYKKLGVVEAGGMYMTLHLERFLRGKTKLHFYSSGVLKGPLM